MQDKIRQLGDTPVPLKYIIPVVAMLSGVYVAWDKLITHEENTDLHLGSEKFYKLVKERDKEIQILRDRIEVLEWTDSINIHLNGRRHQKQADQIKELKAKL